MPQEPLRPIDEAILQLGTELQRLMHGQAPGLFDRRHWEGKLLDRAMADPQFKRDLFRFVDVFPSLNRPDQVVEHIREYLLREGRDLQGLLGVAVQAASLRAAAGLTAGIVRRNIEGMARRFIVGRNAADALPHLRALHDEGLAFVVDLLGEATVSNVEADGYAARYVDLIESLPTPVARWPSNATIDQSHLGPLPRTNVSVKVSSLAPHLDPADLAGGVARLKGRVLPLAAKARQAGASLHIDLESSELHDLTFALFEELAADPALRDWPHLGMTVQAYLRQAAADVQRIGSIATSRDCPVAVRLVKGAYWEAEVVRARQQGYACPVFLDKAATDASFEAISEWMLDRPKWFQPAFASHNLRSLANAVVYAEQKGVPREAIEIQTLFGMAEPERAAFRSLGHRVRVYSPVGELLPGMAYLVRRLLENSSNEGFLRLSHREGAQANQLFARPVIPAKPRILKDLPRGLRDPFGGCPLLDFSEAKVRTSFAESVAETSATLPRKVPIVINGKERHGGETWLHPCPSRTDRTATIVTLATSDEARQAVAGAVAAWPGWRDLPVLERAKLLDRLGDGLEADRYNLAALQVFEVGKSWREADADVAEAVDFCRYYALQALVELEPRTLGDAPGEHNVLSYEGVGPAVVIPPWNFPLAIPTGLVAAALVAGNTVIFKPAEQASATGYTLFGHLIKAGIPSGVVQFVPGIGETVGDQLVRDPRVAIVAFTGSRAVGLSIWEAAGKTDPGQSELKRVICEMGGKNALIVDEDADLDAAVTSIVQSAFGYAGQKCSACSRVITVGDAHEPLVSRLVEATRSLAIGPAENPGFQVGPVIDRSAWERLQTVIASPGEGATSLLVGTAPAGGHYIAPALFEVSDPLHPLMQEEFFGPVVALYHAASFSEALAIGNGTPYALTGAVFSRKPTHLEKARQAFRVGNLYLNRGCTGAKVARQPFGGFGLSGGGTKAGGPGYLLRFCNPRCITENTVRRGFVPEFEGI